MLALQSPKNSSNSHQENSSITPNILPCRIHHEGPVDVSTRYWNPVVDKGNPDTATAYFRGRRLRGRKVHIPEGYQGVLASQTDRKLELPISESASNQITGQDYAHGELDGDEDEADEGDREPETTILEKQGTFSEFVVWDHDRVPAADDPFVKGISEWIRFSEAMHLTPSDTPQQDKAGSKAGKTGT